jgi:gas vesicle protein
MDYFRDDSTSTFLMGVATGLAVGALAMFVFDPQQGRRRRALARDKAMHYSREAGKLVSSTSQDLKNRAYGLAKETEGMVREQMGTAAGTETPQNR